MRKTHENIFVVQKQIVMQKTTIILQKTTNSSTLVKLCQLHTQHKRLDNPHSLSCNHTTNFLIELSPRFIRISLNIILLKMTPNMVGIYGCFMLLLLHETHKK